MAIWQLMVADAIKKQEEDVANSFMSRNAYSKEYGIRIGEFYVDGDKIKKSIISKMLSRGVIRREDGIYWFNKERFEGIQKRNNKIIAIGFLIVVVIFLVMYWGMYYSR